MKYAWELEELDPSNGSDAIPYVVKRLREDDEGDLVFKKVYSANWRQALTTIRTSLDLLEKTFTALEELKAKSSKPT